MRFAKLLLHYTTNCLMMKKDIKILLIDDNEINSLFAGIMFSKLGITFNVACNKKQAMEHLSKETYDLILLDIQLPNHDGYDIAREVRLSDHKVPIIAFTSLPEEEVLPKALESGMNEYILKPSGMQELQSLVEHYKQSA